MSQKEQIDRFRQALEAVISNFAAEYDLTVATAVGVLELVKLDLVDRERGEMES